MKITCDRELFSEAFHSVIGAVPSKTPKDILMTVQVKADDNFLEMVATDMDIAIKTRIENIKVDQPGTVNLLASKTSMILKKSMDDMLTLEEVGQAIRIKIGRNKFNLVSVAPDEFPAMEEFPKTNVISLPASSFRELTHKTCFATSKDSSRWALNGVFLNVEGDILEAVATDSKRLAYFKTQVTNTENVKSGIIIPSRAMNEANKIIGPKDQTIQVAFAEKHIFFKTEKGYMASRLVDGKFPPYKQVLPPESDRIISVSRIPLTNAIEQASIFVSENSSTIKISVSGETMELKSRSPDAGESEVTVNLDVPAEFKIDIGFNPGYILEFLRVIDQESVMIQLKDNKSMGVFLPKGDENYKYLVMPVSLEF